MIFLSYQDKGDDLGNSEGNQRIKNVKERSVFENPLDRIKNAIVQPFNNPVNPIKSNDRIGEVIGGKDNKFVQEFKIDHRKENKEDDDDPMYKFEKPDPDAPGKSAFIIKNNKRKTRTHKKLL